MSIEISKGDTVRRVTPSCRPEIWGEQGKTYEVQDVRRCVESIQVLPGGGFSEARNFEVVRTAADDATHGKPLDGPPLSFLYTNWKGETARRQVQPVKVEYKATHWHPDPQWILTAWDVEKEALRDFAIADIVPGCFGDLTPEEVDALRANAWTDGAGDAVRGVGPINVNLAEPYTPPEGRRALLERGLETSPRKHAPGEVVVIGHGDPVSPFGWIKEIFHGFTPSVDPDEADMSAIFPRPLTVETSSFATFIIENGDAVACLTGDDHHERGLAFVRGVQGGRRD